MAMSKKTYERMNRHVVLLMDEWEKADKHNQGLITETLQIFDDVRIELGLARPEDEE